ncbi:hypothetical protein ON064_04020 [Planococcus sp. A6]|uniref:hypothetical protein n=1 Tax=Planococcus sp. A6 TaxID=2992760 RepID=UPI00237B402F|nr:hypothetical protein [Planococcus sp. A6]MDE0582212.1 hypothetical protein [Planococcus sp. A6]
MDLKTEMKYRSDLCTEGLKQLKKQRKSAEKEKDSTEMQRLAKLISHQEKRKTFFSASKYEPVRFENGLVINAKLVDQYLKKLPKMAMVTIFLQEGLLKIEWEVPRSSSGVLALKDLADHYQGFELQSGEERFHEHDIL